MKNKHMELKEFISETILQISSGILDAMDKCSELDVIVNPDITVGSEGSFYVPKQGDYPMQRRVQIIDMDIAITVSQVEENTMGAKIGVSMLGIGGETKGGSNKSSENRVRFSIPVCLPSSKTEIKPVKKPNLKNMMIGL